jgi:hypothetical protein
MYLFVKTVSETAKYNPSRQANGDFADIFLLLYLFCDLV